MKQFMKVILFCLMPAKMLANSENILKIERIKNALILASLSSESDCENTCLEKVGPRGFPGERGRRGKNGSCTCNINAPNCKNFIITAGRIDMSDPATQSGLGWNAQVNVVQKTVTITFTSPQLQNTGFPITILPENLSGGPSASAVITSRSKGEVTISSPSLFLDFLVATCTCSSSADCPAGETCCGGGCANLLTDPNNCGSCDNTCPTGQSCIDGTCTCTTTQCGLVCCPTTTTCPDCPTCMPGSHGTFCANCLGCCCVSDSTPDALCDPNVLPCTPI